MEDCVNAGWVLEDYPRTLEQAQALTRKQIIPDLVYYMDQPLEESYKIMESKE